MLTVSTEFNAWLATPSRAGAYCLSITRRDGTTVRGTSWVRDVPIGSDIYASASGGASISNLESSSEMSVNNSEVQINFGPITAADLKAGLYSGCSYSFLYVNPEDLTMGVAHLSDGDVGNVTVDRLSMTAEFRSLMQRLQQSLGRICSPTCPYNTFDDDCGLIEADFTETGTLTAVSVGQMAFQDAARTEAGPAGAIAITAMTRGNPTRFTLAAALNQPNGTAVVLSDIVGPVALIGTITAYNVNNGTFTFEVNIDTTDVRAYPNFISGKVTPMGSEAGFFDYALMRMTSGANFLTGLAREVKGYVNNGIAQWSILGSPFPYPVTAGDTYSMTWGDDHTFATCKTKFGNGRRFGGDPFVPGLDSVVQVARNE